MRWLRPQVDEVIVASSTFEFQDTWDPVRKMIDIDHDSLAVVLDYVNKKVQEAVSDEGRKKGMRLKTKRLIVLDDVTHERSLKQSSGKGTLAKLCYNAAHWNISLLVITHSMQAISSSLKGNCEFLFLFNTTRREEIEELYKAYGIARSKKQAELLFDQEIWNNIQTGKDKHPFLMWDLASGGILYFKMQEKIKLPELPAPTRRGEKRKAVEMKEEEDKSQEDEPPSKRRKKFIGQET